MVTTSQSRTFPYKWLLILAICMLPALAAPPSPEASDKHVQRLREEIARLQTELDKANRSELTLQKEIVEYDRKIALKKRLSRELQLLLKKNKQQLKQQKQRTDDVTLQWTYTASRAQELQKRLHLIQDQMRMQVVTWYKYHRHPFWFELLRANSIREVLSRMRLYALLQRTEQRATTELLAEHQLFRSSEVELNELRTQYVNVYDQARRAVQKTERQHAALRNEESALQSEFAKRKKKLASVKTSQVQLEKKIGERQASLRDIQRTIEQNLAEQEKRRKEQVSGSKATTQGSETRQANKDWSKLQPTTRGALRWPVRGDVVQRFGWQRGGAYGTTTESPGIEIAASPGTPVLAAAEGIVAQRTWLRGFGTTVILEHANGIFTVYAHLGSVDVNNGQAVARNQRIGNVAAPDDGSEATLHFEVWDRRAKQDPLGWLERR
ncbi:MAG: peptidoglycan DD-metalloendopeptidase family protein [bacterium]|nr:peptidoglycan DD-metalloendopeptidase family protein [bacterium]